MDWAWRDVALAIAATIAVGQTLRLWLQRRRPAWRLRRRARAAAEGERRAWQILEAAGYRVVGEQVAGRLRYRVDGAPLDVDVRADLLARRWGRTYLAEVKTGEVAPRPDSVATRRQLLEYAHAFEVDGILLVDATRETISEIGVPDRPARSGIAVHALLAAAAGSIVLWLLWS